jgi:hypothetical protein
VYLTAESRFHLPNIESGRLFKPAIFSRSKIQLEHNYLGTLLTSLPPILELRFILKSLWHSLKFDRAAAMDWAGTWSNSSRLGDMLCRADSNLEFETPQCRVAHADCHAGLACPTAAAFHVQQPLASPRCDSGRLPSRVEVGSSSQTSV